MLNNTGHVIKGERNCDDAMALCGVSAGQAHIPPMCLAT